MPGVSDFIINSLAYDQYAFSWEDLKNEIKKSDAALKNDLARLVRKKEIMNLRRGFYVIVPPRYRNYGKLPVELYVDKLFKYLNKPYYIAFYSSAAFHGASHQQVQKEYLITQVPNLRDIKKGTFQLDISATSNWPKKNIIQKKSDAGYFNLSSPALTAIDLIYFQSKLGGINRMLSIIEELIEEIKPEDINDLLTWYPHVSAIQRLGFLLNRFQAEQVILNSISVFLEKSSYYPVLLSPEKREKAGSTDNPWKVDVNIEMETDQ